MAKVILMCLLVPTALTMVLLAASVILMMIGERLDD